MTKVRATTATGGRKLTPEHRAKIQATNKAKFAAMSPAEQEAIRARLDAGRRPRKPATDPPVSTQPAGGRSNPFALTPLELLRSLRHRPPSGEDPPA